MSVLALFLGLLILLLILGTTPTEQDYRAPVLQDGSANNIVTTELNSLANNALVISSVYSSTGVFSNQFNDSQGGGAPLFTLHLHLASIGSAFTANTYIDGWFLKSDGTNYESGSASITPARQPDFSFPLIAQTAAQDVELVVPAPIGALNKVLVRNNGTGQALAASGNYISASPTTVKVPSV